MSELIFKEPQEVDVVDSEESLLQEYYSTEELRDAMLQSMDWFAGIALPEVATMKFPDWYSWLWERLTKSLMDTGRNFDKYAVGLPRGHGKTMVVKLLVLFAVLFTGRKYVLIIGANLKKAEAILSDIADMLDSPNIRRIFGCWRFDIKRDTTNLKRFSINGRTVILEAAGQGTAIRGSQQDNSRPDLMVFDDAQTKECAESLTESDSYANWFYGTALKAKSPIRCMYIYIGNMYKDLKLVDTPGKEVYACMLRNLHRSPEWTSFVVGGILSDGSALWEELQPLRQLMSEFRGDLEAGRADIFFAEVLNDPQTTVSHYLDADKIGFYEISPEYQHQGNFIIIDPATSKATPDQIAIGYHEVYDNVPVLAELINDKFSAPKIVSNTLEMALRHNCSLIIVEANAFQYSLVEWFQFFCAQMGIVGIHIEPMYTKGVSKNARILKFFQQWQEGKYLTTKECRGPMLSQALTFDPKITTNVDDILDMGEMASQACVKFRHLMDIPGDLSVSHRLSSQGIPDQLTAPSPSGF